MTATKSYADLDIGAILEQTGIRDRYERAVVKAQTWQAPEGADPTEQSVTQPLNPEVFGFDIVWAERVDTLPDAQGKREAYDNLYVVVYRASNHYLRVSAVIEEPHETYGTAGRVIYDTTVSLPGMAFSSIQQSHGNISGRGPRVDGLTVSLAGRVLTIAGAIIQFLNRDEEETK